MTKTFTCLFLMVTLLYGCSGKPSEKEIKQKLLLEYICPEKAKVNSLKIVKTEETENLIGKPAYRYNVTGEVEWPEGCTDYGSGLQPGTKESFEKMVTLSKGDDGNWQ